MKSRLICLAMLTLAITASPALAADCQLKPSYDELRSRKVGSVTDYQKMERDFWTVNRQHTSRVMRLPPSMQIPATPENIAAKAADLRKVARARMEKCQ